MWAFTAKHVFNLRRSQKTFCSKRRGYYCGKMRQQKDRGSNSHKAIKKCFLGNLLLCKTCCHSDGLWYGAAIHRSVQIVRYQDPVSFIIRESFSFSSLFNKLNAKMFFEKDVTGNRDLHHGYSSTLLMRGSFC